MIQSSGNIVTINPTVVTSIISPGNRFCRILLCTKPSLENGDYEGSHEGPDYQLGEYISAVCLPGYSLSGSQIRRRCAGEDDWSGEDLECIRGKIMY